MFVSSTSMLHHQWGCLVYYQVEKSESQHVLSDVSLREVHAVTEFCFLGIWKGETCRWSKYRPLIMLWSSFCHLLSLFFRLLLFHKVQKSVLARLGTSNSNVFTSNHLSEILSPASGESNIHQKQSWSVLTFQDTSAQHQHPYLSLCLCYFLRSISCRVPILKSAAEYFSS